VPCSYVPVPVATTVRFVTIDAGFRTTCALSTDQRVYCWGNNVQGTVGLLTGYPDVREPVEIAGGMRYESLSVGWQHACAVVVDGSTRCWGFNSGGQLGDATTERRFEPTPLETDPGFVLLAAGKQHTCGLAVDHTAYCWGEAVGIEPTGRFGASREGAPLPTVDRTPMDTLASGATFSCGIFADSIVRCWGDNSSWKLGGPLPGGYPLNTASDVPVAIQLDATFSTIATGFANACGVRTGGAVYCWGDGVEGELGDGEPHEYAGPQEITRPVRVDLPFR
jgi:alpha-tubulin suppressor-like RCC1 family protein